jgi:hypothetical protein
MRLRSARTEWLIHGIHASGHSMIHIHGNIFSDPFFDNIWFVVIGSYVMGPFVLEERMTSEIS